MDWGKASGLEASPVRQQEPLRGHCGNSPLYFSTLAEGRYMFKLLMPPNDKPREAPRWLLNLIEFKPSPQQAKWATAANWTKDQ